MAKLVSIFISARHRRLIGVVTWLAVFAAVLAALAAYAAGKTRETMVLEARETAQHFVRLRGNLASTVEAMHRELTAQPCSPAFNDQLRKIAYLPDGLNEFLYAPGGLVRCSVNIPLMETPVQLDEPDVPWQSPAGFALWLDRDLGFLGLTGLTGTIALQEPFAAIIPAQQVDLTVPEWMSLEVVLRDRDGRWWHRHGEEGVYGRARGGLAAGGILPFAGGAMHAVTCDPGGMHCVAAEAELAAVLRAESGAALLALVAAAILASCVAAQTGTSLARYWSFEQRFRRHLDADSVVCAYQPLMDLQSGEIIGCEVLARWRDVDDGIVFPDKFIPLVERHGLTARFTRMVASRAAADLVAHLPPDRRIQVNFNIFPQDLDSRRLLAAFSAFTARPDVFDLVLEIVESDEIPSHAQREIEALRRAGVKTYIDDFGTGYSNMQNLAALSVDGIKLDRSFAMAPDNSMMAQMLVHAIRMIQATGRVMVVEGVETAERLQLLRDMSARIDIVQGYFVSRPLDIAGFIAFLGGDAVARPRRGRAAA